MRKHLALALLLAMASAAHAQNLTTIGVVNGVPTSGTGTVSTLDGSVGASADTAATAGSAGTLNAKLRLMTTQMNSILGALGSGVFQAGGSIGNTQFGATQVGSWSTTVTQATGTNLHMVCDSGCSSSSAPADAASFTFATTSQTPIGGVFQTTATSNPLTNGQMGAWQMTANRAGFVNLRNSSGTEIGTTAAPVVATGSGTAGSAAAGVATVQGIASMTPLFVQSGTSPVVTMNSASANSGFNAALAAVFDDTSPTAITENSFGMLRMSANRNLYGTIRDAAGNERGANVDSSNRLATAPSIVSGAVASGAYASGSIASGAFASGALASGSIASGAMVDLLTFQGTKAAGTAAANSLLTGGVYNTSLPTLTSGQQAAAQFDSSGRLIVNIGAGASSGAVAQGSTTSGQTGSLVQCAVTTSAPTYTTAQTSPVSCDTSGATRVTVMNNGVAQAATTSGTTVSPVGGGASSSEPTAVTDGQIARALVSLTGKAINLPYAVPENTLNGQITSAMTGTTSTAVTGMGAQGAGIRNYVTACTFSNTHATVSTMINLQDGSGGSVLWQAPAAAVYGGAAVQFPTPIKTTANTGLFAVNATTGASTLVSCTGYKGV